MSVTSLIDVLNNLTTGEFSSLESRVRQVRDESAALRFDEVVSILDDALASLDAFDVKGFRKKVQHAVSRLGHLRRRKPAVLAGASVRSASRPR